MRFIAFLTAAIFLSTNAVWANPIGISQGAELSPVPKPFPQGIEIPEALGTLQNQYRFPEEKGFIVFIQDAHAIVDAQNNIASLIEYLQKRYGIDLVALEGGEGELDPTLFRTFPDEIVKKKLMKDYLERAEITGAQWAAVFSAKNPGGSASGGDLREARYVGIEDWNLYEENYLAYLRAVQNQDGLLRRLAEIKAGFDRERKSVFSPSLNTFHEKVEAFEAERSHLFELLTYLANRPSLRALDIDGVDGKDEALLRRSEASASQRRAISDIEKYPHLSKLLYSLKQDSALPKDQLETAIRRLADDFRKQHLAQLDKHGKMEFNRHTQAFVTGQMDLGEFLKYLVRAGKPIGVRPRLDPQMQALIGQVETLSTIKGTKLFDELRAFLAEAERGLIKTPEERSLAAQYQKLRFLQDLVRLELDRDRLDTYQKAPDSYLELLGDASAREAVRPALEFYRVVLERDRAFHENLTKLLKKNKSQTAIVLAGGFHSTGFEKSLKEAGYSYAVVTPKIRSLEGKERYEAVMKGDLSYKKYLETTFYDAFVRHATERLVAGLNQPDFKRNLKLWRDQVIRKLASEGRTGEAGEYTRYIDRLLKIYHDKFGSDGASRSKEEIQRELERALEASADEAVNSLWAKFQTQFNSFVSGLRQLADRKEFTVDNVSRLLGEEEEAPARQLAPARHLAGGGGRPAAMAQFGAVSGMIQGNRIIRSEIRNFLATGEVPQAVRSELRLVASRNQITDVLREYAKGIEPSDLKGLMPLLNTLQKVAGVQGRLRSEIRSAHPEDVRTEIDRLLSDAASQTSPSVTKGAIAAFLLDQMSRSETRMEEPSFPETLVLSKEPTPTASEIPSEEVPSTVNPDGIPSTIEFKESPPPAPALEPLEKEKGFLEEVRTQTIDYGAGKEVTEKTAPLKGNAVKTEAPPHGDQTLTIVQPPDPEKEKERLAALEGRVKEVSEEIAGEKRAKAQAGKVLKPKTDEEFLKGLSQLEAEPPEKDATRTPTMFALESIGDSSNSFFRAEARSGNRRIHPWLVTAAAVMFAILSPSRVLEDEPLKPEAIRSVNLQETESSELPELTVDLEEIAKVKLDPSLSFKLYRLKGTSIYYLEFASLAIQNQAFNRLSVFIESSKHAGKILSDEVLNRLFESRDETPGIGYDYRLQDIARFYEEAERQEILLNEVETQIKKELLNQGLIKQQDGHYEAPENTALISTAQDVNLKFPGFRRATILHELRHGFYFTDPWVRAEIQKIWEKIDPVQQQKVIQAVHSLAGYDPANLDLILNELYASLLDPTSPLGGIGGGSEGWAPDIDVMKFLDKEFRRMESERLARRIREAQQKAFEEFIKKIQLPLSVPSPNDGSLKAARAEVRAGKQMADGQGQISETAGIPPAISHTPEQGKLDGLCVTGDTRLPVIRKEEAEKQRSREAEKRITTIKLSEGKVLWEDRKGNRFGHSEESRLQGGTTPVGRAAVGRFSIWHRAVGSAKNLGDPSPPLRGAQEDERTGESIPLPPEAKILWREEGADLSASLKKGENDEVGDEQKARDQKQDRFTHQSVSPLAAEDPDQDDQGQDTGKNIKSEKRHGAVSSFLDNFTAMTRNNTVMPSPTENTNQGHSPEAPGTKTPTTNEVKRILAPSRKKSEITSTLSLDNIESDSSPSANPVKTKDHIQSIPIRDVRPGDLVLSLNEETGKIEPRRINALLDMGVKPVYRLTTASGRSIKTTANHPYLVKPVTRNSQPVTSSSRWIKVKELRVGDEIGVPAPGNLGTQGVQDRKTVSVGRAQETRAGIRADKNWLPFPELQTGSKNDRVHRRKVPLEDQLIRGADVGSLDLQNTDSPLRDIRRKSSKCCFEIRLSHLSTILDSIQGRDKFCKRKAWDQDLAFGGFKNLQNNRTSGLEVVTFDEGARVKKIEHPLEFLVTHPGYFLSQISFEFTESLVDRLEGGHSLQNPGGGNVVPPASDRKSLLAEFSNRYVILYGAHGFAFALPFLEERYHPLTPLSRLVKELQVGDEIGVPLSVDLSSIVDASHVENVFVSEKLHSNVSETEPVGRRGQIYEGFGKSHRVGSRKKVSKLFSDLARQRVGKFRQVLFGLARQDELISHTVRRENRPAAISRKARSYSRRITDLVSSLKGQRPSSSSMKLPTGFSEKYSSLDKVLQSRSSIRQRNSQKAYISKRNQRGLFSGSKATAARNRAGKEIPPALRANFEKWPTFGFEGTGNFDSVRRRDLFRFPFMAGFFLSLEKLYHRIHRLSSIASASGTEKGGRSLLGDLSPFSSSAWIKVKELRVGDAIGVPATAFPSTRREAGEQNNYWATTPWRSTEKSLPLIRLGELTLRNFVKWGITRDGSGGWSRTTRTPRVFEGGNKSLFKKSLSPDRRARRSAMASLKTAPFLTPFGTNMTSWPSLLRKWAMSRWRSSSKRKRSLFAGGKREELFVLDPLDSVMQSGLNRLPVERGITPENLLDRHPSFEELENGRDRNPRPTKAGLPVAEVRVNRNVTSNPIFHLFPFSVKKPNTNSFWGQSSPIVNQLASLLAPKLAYADPSLTPLTETGSDLLWDRIVSIEYVGREPVFDIEVDGTHNFIGNGIFAHNTYIQDEPGISVPLPSTFEPPPSTSSLPRAEVRQVERIDPAVAWVMKEIEGLEIRYLRSVREVETPDTMVQRVRRVGQLQREMDENYEALQNRVRSFMKSVKPKTQIHSYFETYLEKLGQFHRTAVDLHYVYYDSIWPTQSVEGVLIPEEPEIYRPWHARAEEIWERWKKGEGQPFVSPELASEKRQIQDEINQLTQTIARQSKVLERHRQSIGILKRKQRDLSRELGRMQRRRAEREGQLYRLVPSQLREVILGFHSFEEHLYFHLFAKGDAPLLRQAIRETFNNPGFSPHLVGQSVESQLEAMRKSENFTVPAAVPPGLIMEGYDPGNTEMRKRYLRENPLAIEEVNRELGPSFRRIKRADIGWQWIRRGLSWASAAVAAVVLFMLLEGKTVITNAIDSLLNRKAVPELVSKKVLPKEEAVTGAPSEAKPSPIEQIVSAASQKYKEQKNPLLERKKAELEELRKKLEQMKREMETLAQESKEELDRFEKEARSSQEAAEEGGEEGFEEGGTWELKPGVVEGSEGGRPEILREGAQNVDHGKGNPSLGPLVAIVRGGSYNVLATQTFHGINRLTGEFYPSEPDWIDVPAREDPDPLEGVEMFSYGQTTLVVPMPRESRIKWKIISVGFLDPEKAAKKITWQIQFDRSNEMWKVSFSEDPGRVIFGVEKAGPEELGMGKTHPIEISEEDRQAWFDGLPASVKVILEHAKKLPMEEQVKEIHWLLGRFYYTPNPRLGEKAKAAGFHSYMWDWLAHICGGLSLEDVSISYELGLKDVGLVGGFLDNGNRLIHLGEGHMWVSRDGSVEETTEKAGRVSPYYELGRRVRAAEWEHDEKIADAWRQLQKKKLEMRAQEILLEEEMKALEEEILKEREKEALARRTAYEEIRLGFEEGLRNLERDLDMPQGGLGRNERLAKQTLEDIGNFDFMGKVRDPANLVMLHHYFQRALALVKKGFPHLAVEVDRLKLAASASVRARAEKGDDRRPWRLSEFLPSPDPPLLGVAAADSPSVHGAVVSSFVQQTHIRGALVDELMDGVTGEIATLLIPTTTGGAFHERHFRDYSQGVLVTGDEDGKLWLEEERGGRWDGPFEKVELLDFLFEGGSWLALVKYEGGGHKSWGVIGPALANQEHWTPGRFDVILVNFGAHTGWKVRVEGVRPNGERVQIPVKEVLGERVKREAETEARSLDPDVVRGSPGMELQPILVQTGDGKTEFKTWRLRANFVPGGEMTFAEGFREHEDSGFRRDSGLWYAIMGRADGSGYQMFGSLTPELLQGKEVSRRFWSDRMRQDGTITPRNPFHVVHLAGEESLVFTLTDAGLTSYGSVAKRFGLDGMALKDVRDFRILHASERGWIVQVQYLDASYGLAGPLVSEEVAARRATSAFKFHIEEKTGKWWAGFSHRDIPGFHFVGPIWDEYLHQLPPDDEVRNGLEDLEPRFFPDGSFVGHVPSGKVQVSVEAETVSAYALRGMMNGMPITKSIDAWFWDIRNTVYSEDGSWMVPFAALPFVDVGRLWGFYGPLADRLGLDGLFWPGGNIHDLVVLENDDYLFFANGQFYGSIAEKTGLGRLKFSRRLHRVKAKVLSDGVVAVEVQKNEGGPSQFYSSERTFDHFEAAEGRYGIGDPDSGRHIAKHRFDVRTTYFNALAERAEAGEIAVEMPLEIMSSLIHDILEEKRARYFDVRAFGQAVGRHTGLLTSLPDRDFLDLVYVLFDLPLPGRDVIPDLLADLREKDPAKFEAILAQLPVNPGIWKEVFQGYAKRLREEFRISEAEDVYLLNGGDPKPLAIDAGINDLLEKFSSGKMRQYIEGMQRGLKPLMNHLKFGRDRIQAEPWADHKVRQADRERALAFLRQKSELPEKSFDAELMGPSLSGEREEEGTYRNFLYYSIQLLRMNWKGLKLREDTRWEEINRGLNEAYLPDLVYQWDELWDEIKYDAAALLMLVGLAYFILSFAVTDPLKKRDKVFGATAQKAIKKVSAELARILGRRNPELEKFLQEYLRMARDLSEEERLEIQPSLEALSKEDQALVEAARSAIRSLPAEPTREYSAADTLQAFVAPLFLTGIATVAALVFVLTPLLFGVAGWERLIGPVNDASIDTFLGWTFGIIWGMGLTVAFLNIVIGGLLGRVPGPTAKLFLRRLAALTGIGIPVALQKSEDFKQRQAMIRDVEKHFLDFLAGIKAKRASREPPDPALLETFTSNLEQVVDHYAEKLPPKKEKAKKQPKAPPFSELKAKIFQTPPRPDPPKLPALKKRGGANAASMKKPGPGLEFGQHRAYQPGDAVKSIDWTYFGRTDKLEVKVHDKEAQLATSFVINMESALKEESQENWAENLYYALWYTQKRRAGHLTLDQVIFLMPDGKEKTVQIGPSAESFKALEPVLKKMYEEADKTKHAEEAKKEGWLKLLKFYRWDQQRDYLGRIQGLFDAPQDALASLEKRFPPGRKFSIRSQNVFVVGLDKDSAEKWSAFLARHDNNTIFFNGNIPELLPPSQPHPSARAEVRKSEEHLKIEQEIVQRVELLLEKYDLQLKAEELYEKHDGRFMDSYFPGKQELKDEWDESYRKSLYVLMAWVLENQESLSKRELREIIREVESNIFLLVLQLNDHWARALPEVALWWMLPTLVFVDREAYRKRVISFSELFPEKSAERFALYGSHLRTEFNPEYEFSDVQLFPYLMKNLLSQLEKSLNLPEEAQDGARDLVHMLANGLLYVPMRVDYIQDEPPLVPDAESYRGHLQSLILPPLNTMMEGRDPKDIMRGAFQSYPVLAHENLPPHLTYANEGLSIMVVVNLARYNRSRPEKPVTLRQFLTGDTAALAFIQKHNKNTNRADYLSNLNRVLEILGEELGQPLRKSIARSEVRSAKRPSTPPHSLPTEARAGVRGMITPELAKEAQAMGRNRPYDQFVREEGRNEELRNWQIGQVPRELLEDALLEFNFPNANATGRVRDLSSPGSDFERYLNMIVTGELKPGTSDGEFSTIFRESLYKHFRTAFWSYGPLLVLLSKDFVPDTAGQAYSGGTAPAKREDHVIYLMPSEEAKWIQERIKKFGLSAPEESEIIQRIYTYDDFLRLLLEAGGIFSAQPSLNSLSEEEQISFLEDEEKIRPVKEELANSLSISLERAVSPLLAEEILRARISGLKEKRRVREQMVNEAYNTIEGTVRHEQIQGGTPGEIRDRAIRSASDKFTRIDLLKGRVGNKLDPLIDEFIKAGPSETGDGDETRVDWAKVGQKRKVVERILDLETLTPQEIRTFKDDAVPQVIQRDNEPGSYPRGGKGPTTALQEAMPSLDAFSFHLKKARAELRDAVPLSGEAATEFRLFLPNSEKIVGLYTDSNQDFERFVGRLRERSEAQREVVRSKVRKSLVNLANEMMKQETPEEMLNWLDSEAFDQTAEEAAAGLATTLKIELAIFESSELKDLFRGAASRILILGAAAEPVSEMEAREFGEQTRFSPEAVILLRWLSRDPARLEAANRATKKMIFDPNLKSPTSRAIVLDLALSDQLSYEKAIQQIRNTLLAEAQSGTTLGVAFPGGPEARIPFSKISVPGAVPFPYWKGKPLSFRRIARMSTAFIEATALLSGTTPLDPAGRDFRGFGVSTEPSVIGLSKLSVSDFIQLIEAVHRSEFLWEMLEKDPRSPAAFRRMTPRGLSQIAEFFNRLALDPEIRAAIARSA